jgi:pimeloyl-ACP methyl ester carboxylesterase
MGDGLDLDRHGHDARGQLSEESVETAGGRVAYRRSGNGPPLALLHGAFADSRDWLPQLDGLSGDFDVIAWDAPGCGGSFDPPEDFGLAGYADALADFIDALGLERPHICGLSFGGGLAIELARRHPGLPRSLVLASAYAGWAGSLGRDEAERRRAEFMTNADRPLEEVMREFSRTLFTDSVPDEIVDETIDIMIGATRPAGMRAMATAFADADLRDVLPQIDVPTLLIYGDADQRSPLSPVGETLHAEIPGSTLVVFPGIGHVVNLEEPDRFNQEVRSFLLSLHPA